MKQFEFQTYLNDDETVKIPSDVAAQITRDRPVRILLMVPEREEDLQWAQLTAKQFLQGYSNADAIYDDISSR